jgi:hypothetical protein
MLSLSRGFVTRRTELVLISLLAIALGTVVVSRFGSSHQNERGARSADKRIGAAGARELRRSPDGLRLAWLEPAQGNGTVFDLVEYSASANSTRRIHDVLEFAFGPTGEFGVVQPVPRGGGGRLLGIVGVTDTGPKPVGSGDRWWLGPGGFGASQSANVLTAWSAKATPIPVPLRPPVEVTTPEREGPFRLVLRESERGGSVMALRADGRLVRLAKGSGSLAVAPSGDAVAIAGCEGAREQLCLWRGEQFRVNRTREADVVRLEFDAGGVHLAMLSGEGALLLSVDDKPFEALDKQVHQFAWSRGAPLLLWRSGSERKALDVKAWSPSTGVVSLACGDAAAPVESAVASSDGKTVACLERASGRRSGTLSVGSSDGKGAFRRVNDAVVAYGFAPAGDALWMRHSCVRDEESCAIAVLPVTNGAPTGAGTRLTGIGRRVSFDEKRSDRILYDSDLDGWEIVVRAAGTTERLGKGLGWDDVAFVSGHGVAFLRKGPGGGVFLKDLGNEN